VAAPDASVNGAHRARQGSAGVPCVRRRRCRREEGDPRPPDEAQKYTRETDERVILGLPGGGYGDPLEREPNLVARDVEDCLVSAGCASEVYGVVLTIGASSVAVEVLARGDILPLL